MRTSYTFKTPIRSAGEFAERLLSMDETLVSDDPIPYPPNHKVLLNLDDDDCIRIRHYASPTQVSSPILQLDFHSAPYGSEIRCEVLNADAPFSAEQRVALEEFEAWRAEDPDTVPSILGRLWRWFDARYIRPRQLRRGMECFGNKLLAVVKEVAEEQGIIGTGRAEISEAER